MAEPRVGRSRTVRQVISTRALFVKVRERPFASKASSEGIIHTGLFAPFDFVHFR